ncbi:MAG TPA: C39 family peptidase, partial [Thermoanaerobaculales bacterium]|nr:C39 family peptidase [Thermoanaerobaculales bacterium]
MSERELFATLCQLQLPSHCGPCSLSACLFVLGTTATQRELARAAGRPMRVFAHGMDERGLRRAAGAYGVVSEFLLVEERRQGRSFATRLRRHLSAGNPAIMLVGDFEHWVAVIGYLKRRRRFIIVDPKDESSVFRLWSEQTLIRRGWNVNGGAASGEPDQFFATLLSRADGALYVTLGDRSDRAM